MLRHVSLLMAFVLVFGINFFTGSSPKAEAAISSRPVSHIQVKGDRGQDGEVLATKITTIKNHKAIVVGGNFDYVLLPNGDTVRAKNFVIVKLLRPNEILFAGQVNGHVRALSVDGYRLYLGGDFTNVQAQSRNYIAAFARENMALLGFNPGSDRPVYGLDADNGRVVYGGKSSLVRAANMAGRVIWSKSKTTGDVKVVFMHPNGNSAYVGGLFDTFGGRRQHGLVRVNARTGRLYSFNPKFRYDRPLNHYNGDSILSLAWGRGRLIVGSGGAREDGSKNALWSLNAKTGSRWRSGWGREYIRHSADVQAVGVYEGRVYTGFHRNLARFRPGHGRFIARFNLRTGRVSRWDPGFWGNQRNQAGSNNGISSISTGYGYMVIGGAFLGTGDRNETMVGRAGTRRQGIAVFH